MEELKDVSLMLQKDKATLSDCSLIVDELVEMVDRSKKIQESRFYKYHLRKKYLDESSDTIGYPSFEMGVI